MRYKSSITRTALPLRTLDYLEHGASEGQRNAELFDAACQFRDAAISLDEAEGQLLARAVMDGLSETEARTTIRSVFGKSPREPATSVPSRATAPTAKPRSKIVSSSPVPLPPPLENGFVRLLDTCFKPDEYVAIAPAQETEDGEIAPTRGVTLTREEWKAKVNAKGGLERCFSTKLGLFIRINPMQRDGAKNDDVTAFRHALVEFDRDETGASVPKEAQYAAILASGLPVAALIDSGNKSLHAWVCVDAPDAAEYKRRVDLIWAAFDGQALDKQNRNPSRLSRCPDGRRTVDGEVRVQKLLAVGFGAASWVEWEAEHGADALPKIVSGPEFMAKMCPEPPQIIQNVLHQGCKMIIGGASKSRKSWSLMDLMLSVSSGVPWWGFQTQRGRVLYINFELPNFAFQNRLKSIASAKGITNYSGLDLWNLRGYATDFSDLIPKILARIKQFSYSLIILDPVYKGLGKRDENKAGDIASLCNEIEQLAVQSGAAVVFGAHYSKGNQAGKDAIDRIGGSGVFARDPDVILTMTPHEEKDAYVVDLTLRALPQVEPFVVRWADVVFTRDNAADASKVRKRGKSGKPSSKCTYRRGGGIAEKYGSCFEMMPPMSHLRPDRGESEVIRYVQKSLESVGQICDGDKARRVFDVLRNKKYGVLIFKNNRWQGCNFDANTECKEGAG